MIAEAKKYKTGSCSHIDYCESRIYTLSDKSGNVFYVGCTKGSVADRMAAHIREAQINKKDTRKNQKIASLNFDIVATIIDTITETLSQGGFFTNRKGQELEAKWIHKYLELGYDLVNVRIPNLLKKPTIKEEIGVSITTQDLQQSYINLK